MGFWYFVFGKNLVVEFPYLIVWLYSCMSFNFLFSFCSIEFQIMQVSMNLSTSMGVERRLKFRNRKCRCGVRAEVMISDSRDNPYRLFFRC